MFVINIEKFPSDFKEAWEALEPRQKLFCIEYTENIGEEPQWKTYQKVYRCKDISARRSSSVLLANHNVLRVIKYLKDAYFELAITRLGVDKLSIINDLKMIKDKCMNDMDVLHQGKKTGFLEMQNPNAAVSAIKEMTRLLIMEDQKKTHVKKQTGYDEGIKREFESIPTDPVELQRWHAERARRARQASPAKP